MTFDSAEFHPSLAQGIGGSQAIAHKVFGTALDMEAQLCFHSVLQQRSSCQCLEKRTEARGELHISSEVVRRMPAIIAAMRFHLAVSDCNSRRPSVVRR